VTTDPVAPTTIPRTTTTTSTPDFSFDDSVPPPKLINTGTNYVAILKSLSAYGNWLAAHRPDPALVSTIVAGGTKENELFKRDLTRLRDNNRRATEQLGDPTLYTILSARPDAFSAKSVEDIRVHRSILPTGKIGNEVRYTGRTTSLILVVLVHNRWHFAAYDAQPSMK